MSTNSRTHFWVFQPPSRQALGGGWIYTEQCDKCLAVKTTRQTADGAHIGFSPPSECKG